MSFLRNLVRRSAGLSAETPVRPPRGLPVFGPPATEAATIESLDSERGPPAAEPPAVTTREARTGIPEPAERAVRAEPEVERPAGISMPDVPSGEPPLAARTEAPARVEPAREDQPADAPPVRAEPAARVDRAPEPPARVEVPASPIVPPKVEDELRPVPETPRPAAVEGAARVAPAEADRPAPPPPPRPSERRQEPPVPRAPEAVRPTDVPRAATPGVPRERPAARPAPQPRPVERPRLEAPRAAPASEPPVEIRIGRVEVRAPRVPEPAPAPPPPAERGFGDLALARRGLERRWY